MIDKMAREFLGIVRHLLNQPNPWIKNGRLLVMREQLLEMLNKHAYLDATTKLTLWRKLHWLDADQDHFTRPARMEGGSLKRVVMLDLVTYEALCEMREMSVE